MIDKACAEFGADADVLRAHEAVLIVTLAQAKIETAIHVLDFLQGLIKKIRAVPINNNS